MCSSKNQSIFHATFPKSKSQQPQNSVSNNKNQPINEQKIIYNMKHSKCSKKSTFFITNFPSPIFRLIGLPMTRPQKSDRSRLEIRTIPKFPRFQHESMAKRAKRNESDRTQVEISKRKKFTIFQLHSVENPTKRRVWSSPARNSEEKKVISVENLRNRTQRGISNFIISNCVTFSSQSIATLFWVS